MPGLAQTEVGPLFRRATADELDAWVLATAPRAVAYAASLLRDRSQAEDVVQDCYCRLLQKADAYDLLRDGQKILFRSITNACINRTTRDRRLVSLDDNRCRDDGRAWEPADADGIQPDQVLMHKELEGAVAEGLAQLPEQHRAALELRCLGHSQREVAEILETTVSNAGVLIHRARQALAAFLTPFVGETLG